jgi:hypothetical protein
LCAERSRIVFNQRFGPLALQMPGSKPFSGPKTATSQVMIDAVDADMPQSDPTAPNRARSIAVLRDQRLDPVGMVPLNGTPVRLATRAQ